MTKTFKQTMSIILSALIMLSIFAILPTAASAAESGEAFVAASTYDEATKTTFKYAIRTDGTVTIKGFEGTVTNLVIPSTLAGRTVTKLKWSFSFWDNCESIYIPATVKKISISCNTTGATLQNIIVDNDNAKYSSEDGVLFNKDKTELIAYPGGNISTSYTIPNSVTCIGVSAFWGCTNLESITIPDSVTSIGSWAFEYCRSLTGVTIPDSVTSIKNGAFSNCTSLTSIAISENNEYYASVDGVLFNKDITELICYPAEKADIYYTIPDSVTSIGDLAFNECTSLTSITVSENNEYYSSVDGVLFNKDITELICYPAGKADISYTIPDSVTSIGWCAFYYCTSLTSITISDSVTSIGAYAFSECTSLTSVTIGDNVTSIGAYAFYYCTSLTSITIGDNVTYIGVQAFDNTAYYNDLNNWQDGKLYLNNYLLSSEYYDYLADDYYDDYYYDDGEDDYYYTNTIDYDYTLSDDGTLYIWGDSAVINPNGDSVESAIPWYSQRESIINVVIEDGITGIGNYSFWDCSNLKTATIPASVTSIGEFSFFSGGSLESINVSENNAYYSSEDGVLFDKDKTKIIIYPDGKSGSYVVPDTVTSIGDHAVRDCSGLTDITITENVTSIGYGAFYDCTSLLSVTIPANVTEIGYHAFGYRFRKGTDEPIENFTIYGYSGTAVESYANENDITFVDLNSPTTATTTTATDPTTAPTEPTTTATDPTEPTTATTKVSVSAKSKTLYVKGTYSIKPTVENASGTTTYKSSNSKIATVSSTGKVTAKKAGSATITVTNNGVSAKVKITVKNPKLNKKSVTLKKGKSFKLKITGLIGKATFKSNNKKVAKVNAKGKITAKKKGKTTITVTANGVKLQCKVKVKK